MTTKYVHPPASTGVPFDKLKPGDMFYLAHRPGTLYLKTNPGHHYVDNTVPLQYNCVNVSQEGRMSMVDLPVLVVPVKEIQVIT